MEYKTDVSLNIFPDDMTHEARRQRGHELATSWIDGEHGIVLKATKKSPQLLAATFLSLVEADFYGEACLLCERVMGIDKSDEGYNRG
jgi:hypothetical protein